MVSILYSGAIFKTTLLHPFNGSFSRTTQVSRYQKGKTNLDFTEARDSEWQWHQLGHMQVCTLLHTDNHTRNPPLCFLQAECPSCRPTNSVKVLKSKLLQRNVQTPIVHCVVVFYTICCKTSCFSALRLLVGHLEEHLVCKN